MKKSRNIFYAGSFLSYIGDGLLLYALPTGLGLTTGEISSTVLMFLIPGFAVLISTFLSNYISKRQDQSKNDYAKLLLVIGAVELIVGSLAFYTNDPFNLTIICSVFVALYAFSKEGISRLFYSVQVYKFFCKNRDYQNVVSTDFSLRVLALLLAGIVSSFLVNDHNWKYALFFDAITFIIMGLLIVCIGKQPNESNSKIQNDEGSSKATGQPTNNIELERKLKYIMSVVPTRFYFGALFFPYLPIIAEKMQISMAANNLVISTLISVPIIVASKKAARIFPNAIYGLIGIPSLLYLAGLAFILYPNFYTMVLAMFVYSVNSNVFPVFDYPIRNQLSNQRQIDFNTRLTRRMAIAQAVGCVIAFNIFKQDSFQNLLIISALATPLVYIYYQITASNWKYS